MARSKDLKTPLARVSYAAGLHKVQTNDEGKKHWGCSLHWAKTDNIDALKALAAEAAVAEWGDKAIAMIKDGLIKSPFLDGDGPQGKSKKTGEPKAGYSGTTFIRVISGEAFRPKVVDQKRFPITEESELKSGDYVYAVVNAFTWENPKTGKGISFGVSMVQKAKTGESLGGGGGGNPEEYFDVIEDAGETPEAAKTGAGAAALFS